MKNSLLLAAAFGAASLAQAESILAPLNDQGIGTFSGHIQSLSMYRDFEGNNPGNANSTTLGLQLSYASPEAAGLSVGATYNYAEPLHASDDSNNGKSLLSNGRIDVFTEAYGQYNFGALNASNTTLRVGRQIVNGELFRADAFRQKSRALEGVFLSSKDIKNTVVTLGHVKSLSNVWDNEDAWKFDTIGEVLTKDSSYDDTAGVTWGEVVYSGFENLELAVYEGYAHEIANVAGTRLKFNVAEDTALLGYYRHENSISRYDDTHSYEADMFGLSVQQKIGKTTLESGYFGVQNGNLLFQEANTGINHALGSSMMIYPKMFNEGADTAYLKAVSKVGKTVLYALYNYTWHDHDKTNFDGQELNVVVKRPVADNFSVAVKVGAGHLDGKAGRDDTTATDARLFLTYKF